MSKRIKMTVDMEVTVPQALALQAMFEHWNRLSSMGSSRYIAFFVDGDGNFHPHCQIKFSEEVPELTDVLRDRAMGNKVLAEVGFDFDPIAWSLRKSNTQE